MSKATECGEGLTLRTHVRLWMVCADRSSEAYIRAQICRYDMTSAYTYTCTRKRLHEDTQMQLALLGPPKPALNIGTRW